MKAFKQYLAESVKTYDFRIRMACECSSETVSKLKVALEAFQLDAMSKPKRLPVQESPEFPNIGPTEINVIDVSLHYPTTDSQLRIKVAECCGIHASKVKVTPSNSPYEAALAGLEQSNLQKPGESVLEQDEMTTAAPEKDLVGDARIPSLIKELEETRKYKIEYAAKQEAAAKTTNDLPQYTQSPIAGKNKIVDVNKMKAGNGK